MNVSAHPLDHVLRYRKIDLSPPIVELVPSESEVAQGGGEFGIDFGAEAGDGDDTGVGLLLEMFTARTLPRGDRFGSSASAAMEAVIESGWGKLVDPRLYEQPADLNEVAGALFALHQFQPRGLLFGSRFSRVGFLKSFSKC